MTRPREPIRSMKAARTRAWRERQAAGLRSAWLAYDEQLARLAFPEAAGDPDLLASYLEDLLNSALERCTRDSDEDF